MTENQGVVYLIDDDAAVRKGLSRLLRSVDMSVETFASAEEFLLHDCSDGTGCILLDLRMGAMDGMDLQSRLVARGCDLPIVFLTGHGDIPMTVRAMKQGALDFLTKPVDEEVLLEAVREGLARHCALLAERDRMRSLTPRELEVLRCVITGALNKQIADRLGIAEKTVKVHRGRVMKKLGLTAVTDLVQVCQRAGVKPLTGQ